jgi:hypothetical protein
MVVRNHMLNVPGEFSRGGPAACARRRYNRMTVRFAEELVKIGSRQTYITAN